MNQPTTKALRAAASLPCALRGRCYYEQHQYSKTVLVSTVVLVSIHQREGSVIFFTHITQSIGHRP